MDLYLGDPSHYAEDEREKLLGTLLEVLKADDQMVYEIAWDIPSKVLPYFESSFDFESGPLATAPCLQNALAIFGVLTSKGNPKELFLKCLECYESINLSEHEMVKSKTFADRFFELKFVAIYESMFASLHKAQAQFPSRFLAMATTEMLSFLASNLEDMSIRSCYFVLRRYFMFARDYCPVNSEDTSETEQHLQRRLIQRFVTDVMAIGLQKYPAKWARRLFVEFRHGVAFNPDPLVRSSLYQLDEYTVQFNDIIYRLSQMSQSLDIDVDGSFERLVSDSVLEFDADTGHKSDAESESSTVIPGDHVKPEFDFTKAKSPDSIYLSNEGLLLLATSLRFENRTNPKFLPLTFVDLVKLTKRFIMGSEEDASGRNSAGVHDALCFWALWISRKLKPSDVQSGPLDKSQFFAYLHMLMSIAATSSDADLRHIAYSITARLLVLHTKEVRFEYLMDTVQFCPYPSVREATVRLLRDFAVPVKSKTATQPTEKPADIDTVTTSVANIKLTSPSPPSASGPLLTLDPSQTAQIQSVILHLAQLVSASDEGLLSEDFPVLLSWLSYMRAVDTDPEQIETVRSICARILKNPDQGKVENEAGAAMLEMRREVFGTALAELDVKKS